ncbi:MAG: MlaD family protein [Bacteroidales bacterium]|nr:MlaD family protein [Bacteroidales bacterium]
MKIKRELLVGFIFVFAAGLLFWGFSFLKGKDVFTNNRQFIAIYSEVNGLVRANPVSVNGLKIGQVKDMYFEPGNSARIIVEIIISNPIPIPKNSIARIYSADLMGSKEIEIKLGNSKDYVEPWDTLTTDIEVSFKEEVNRQVQPLKKKAENLLLSIDSLVTIVQYVFNRATRENLAQSFENIKYTFDNLESATGHIDTLIGSQKNRIINILANLESITNSFKQNNEKLNNIIANFSSLSDTLVKTKISETLLSTNNAMNEISTIINRINKGEGSLGLLVNDDSLYIQIQKSASDLNKLLEDIRKNPKKYVKFSVF